ncbi:MAG: class I SAM-dependent methyltransferase [Actinomycetota bacterium]|nr:class I SAM-dependent methyltransferase [Actinomycetota bacterium]
MNRKVSVFERDAATNAGYGYTTNQGLSSRLATRRLQDLIQQAVVLEGRTVLDLGCGDGYFTARFWEEGGPKTMVGLDPAPSAVRVARSRNDSPGLHFVVADGHSLPLRDSVFDVALVQGVLHHDDHPLRTISEALRVARQVVILEPNGNNLGLKVIERVSRYHREHHEKSYSTPRLLRWIRKSGGSVVGMQFGGLVPMFSPDWLARATKAVEPAVEKVPVLRALACAVIVLVVERAHADAT